MSKVIELKISLTDIVTPKTFSALIGELIKYLIYHRQQIPYPYERLKYYIKRRREKQKVIVQTDDGSRTYSSRSEFAAEKYFKKAEEAFEILENTFQNIEAELLESNGNEIEEIAILFGATPFSPRDIYRIIIPSLSVGHSESEHSWRRQIANLFREIIISDDLNNIFSRQIGLTNTYVLLKRKKGTTVKSQWFLPKDNYRLSTRAPAAVLSFALANDRKCACHLPVCESPSAVIQCVSSESVEDSSSDLTDSTGVSSELFTYDMSSDSKNDSSLSSGVTEYIKSQNRSVEEEYDNNKYNEECSWYQTKMTLKGFRDCKIDGRSATDFWCFPQDFLKPV